jgi:NAD+ synthase
MFSALEFEEIQKFLERCAGKMHLVLGVSGGIDSAVVAAILSRTFDRTRIHAYFLPEDGNDPNLKDVESLSKKYSLNIKTIEIGPVVKSISNIIGESDRRVNGNIKSRIRMVLLYAYANIHNALVVGTTNRTEFYTGYFTKFGDGACDIEPIMHLYKHDVREAAAFLDIPESIIEKKPSAGLYPGQTDEEELGMSYDELDDYVARWERSELITGSESQSAVMDLIKRSAHKRKPPESLLRAPDA